MLLKKAIHSATLICQNYKKKSTPPKNKTELNFINILIKRTKKRMELIQLNVRKIWGRNVFKLTQFLRKTPVLKSDYWHFWIKVINSPNFGLPSVENSDWDNPPNTFHFCQSTSTHMDGLLQMGEFSLTTSNLCQSFCAQSTRSFRGILSDFS